MTSRERTQKVVGRLNTELYWSARLGSLLRDALESHGGDDSAFEETVRVVGQQWMTMGVAKDPEILIQEADHRLERVLPDNYFLEVLCGGVGMYSVFLRLTPEQVSGYKAGGSEWIRRLSRAISRGELDIGDVSLL